MIKLLNLRLGGLILLCVLLPACQFSANVSVGKEMNQTADNIKALAKCPGTPNCVCSAYPSTKEHIEPIQFDGESAAAIEKMRNIIARMTRAKIAVANDRYIHAEFTSLLFRFVDDLEVLADPESSVLHVRSASRVGRSDFGVNRKRVEEIRQLFNASN